MKTISQLLLLVLLAACAAVSATEQSFPSLAMTESIENAVVPVAEAAGMNGAGSEDGSMCG